VNERMGMASGEMWRFYQLHLISIKEGVGMAAKVLRPC